MERKARFDFAYFRSGNLRFLELCVASRRGNSSIFNVLGEREREREKMCECHSKQSCKDFTYPRACVFVAVTCRRWQRFIRVDSESRKGQREREKEREVSDVFSRYANS